MFRTFSRPTVLNGDAFKMGEPIGAKTVDFEWVQDTRQALVNSDFPVSKSCFLQQKRNEGLSRGTMSQGDVEEQDSFPRRSKRSRP